MAPRKRKCDTDSNGYSPPGLGSVKDSTKRPKLAPDRPSASPAAGQKKGRGTGLSPQQEYYTVRSILKEKRGWYLIDWEDDPTSGEKFKPTWVSTQLTQNTRIWNCSWLKTHGLLLNECFAGRNRNTTPTSRPLQIGKQRRTREAELKGRTWPRANAQVLLQVRHTAHAIDLVGTEKW